MTTSGCSSRNGLATINTVVRNSPLGQMSRSSTSTCPALDDQATGPGLRHPGTVDVTGDEGVEGETVLLGGGDLRIAATLEVGLIALLLQPGRSDTSWVLPSFGVDSVLPARSAGDWIESFTTSAAPPKPHRTPP